MKRRAGTSFSLRILVCLALLLSMTAMVHATTTTLTWDRGAGTSDWNTGNNWSTNIVPPNTSSYYAAVQRTDGPIVTTGSTVNVYRILLNGTGNGTLTVNDGTVNVTNHIYVADVPSATGTLNQNGGAIIVSGTLFISRDIGSVAYVNLAGGTLTTATLSVNTNSGTGAHIDLKGGKLIYTTCAQTLSALIANGYIKAYGGLGTVIIDTATQPGKTILSGMINVKATIPRPSNGTVDMSFTGTTVGWTKGMSAVSHDVYFGTNFADVNNAQPFAGDINYNGIVDFKDLSIVAQHWLLDPTGTNPYAGVNSDNIVDFVDYTLLSQDWKNTSLFKGNQDANSFNPGTLAFGTTYYWRVDEVNEPNTYKGDVWSFSTHSGKASYLVPQDGDTNVMARTALSWTGAPGANVHDIYFGTVNPPPFVSRLTTSTIYNPGGLDSSKQYYWRIDEHYPNGALLTGDTWTFTTMAASAEPEIVFVHASDPQMYWNNCNGSGLDNANWGVTVDKINQLNPDFVLVTGDLVNNLTSGTAPTGATQAAAYKGYRAGLTPTIPVYEVPGNHDLGEGPDYSRYVVWQNYFHNAMDDGIHPWYSFAYGNNFFIALDSVTLVSDFNYPNPTDSMADQELNWLSATLADANTHGYDHIFVFQHYGYTADKWVGGSTHKTILYNLFNQYHVTALFAGHTHYDAYSNVSGMDDITERSCTCNLGSGPPEPGIGIVKVYADRIERESRALSSLPVGSASIKKGPYLIYPGTNSQMTVLWQLDKTTNSSKLEWGTDTTYSLGKVYTTEYGTDHQHKYTITGLTPGTKYYYRISGNGFSGTGSFKAAPASDAANVKFFMYGDTRTNPGSNNTLCGRMISDYGSDAAYQTIVLHVGDWVLQNDEPTWTAGWFTLGANPNIWTAAANMAFMGCAGNHEVNGDPTNRAAYKKYWPYSYVAPPDFYYSYDYGPVHIICLDQTENGGSDPLTMNSEQITWLTNDLAATTKPWKIIVLHAPGWSAASGHPNNQQVQTIVQPLCVTYGVQLVVGGHNHYYSRGVVSGVQHVTTGGGGADLATPLGGQENIITYSRSLDYCKVSISDTTLTCNVYSETGASLDSFTVTR